VNNGEWVAVGAAGLVTGGVVGVLLTRTVWTSAGRRRLVSALLALHAGVAFVVGVVATAAAVRSWQLVGRPTTENASALLQVSRIDGNGSLYALLVLAIAFGTLLAVAALTLAARFAAGSDPAERMVACGVLGLEICLGGYAGAHLLTGSHSPVAILVTLQLPLTMLAMISCWPPADDGTHRVGPG
jgi:hypothetical protein